MVCEHGARGVSFSEKESLFSRPLIIPGQRICGAPWVGVEQCRGRLLRRCSFPDLCGSGEEKPKPGAVGGVVCCSEQSAPLEGKPHSYVEAICSGLEEPVASNSCVPGEQLCPYAAAGACHFGDRCLYLHGDLCEICGLQVLHPFDPEQRKAHEMVTAGGSLCSVRAVVGLL